MAKVVADQDRDPARAKDVFASRLPEPFASPRRVSTAIVRLTAPDGYTASRSYSIAFRARRDVRARAHGSSGLDGGGRSPPSCTTTVAIGDELEVRGTDRRVGSYGTGDSPAPARRAEGRGVVPADGDAAARRGAKRPPPGSRSPRRVGGAHPTTCTTPTRDRRTGNHARLNTRRERHRRSRAPAGPPSHATTIAQPVAPDAIAYVCGSSGFADRGDRWCSSTSACPPRARSRVETVRSIWLTADGAEG